MVGTWLRVRSKVPALLQYKEDSVLFVRRSRHNGESCFTFIVQLQASAAASKQAK